MALKLDREQALRAKPEPVPPVRTEELPDGGLSVTIRLIPRRWVRWLGKDEPVERTFSLDPLGREVYEACDGKSDVKTMIRRFARDHRISPVEAEMSITNFLKTLMSKGLVAVAIERKSEGSPG